MNSTLLCFAWNSCFQLLIDSKQESADCFLLRTPEAGISCCFGYLLHRAAVGLGITGRKSVCNKAQTVPFVDIIICKTFWRVSQLPDYSKIRHQNCSLPMNSITEGFCLLCFQKDKPPKRKTK